MVCSAGLEVGSVVSIALPNSISFVATFLGAVYARCVAAPLNPNYTVDEFKFYLEDSKAKLVIVPPAGNKVCAQCFGLTNSPLALSVRVHGDDL